MDLLNAFVALANYVLVPGIAYGSQLALGALGVTLVYGILRFSNFAHGDTMALGAMSAVLITWGFQSLGLSLGVLPTALLALPFAIIITIGLLLGTDKLVYSFYREKKAKPVIFRHRLAGGDFRLQRHHPLHHRRRGSTLSGWRTLHHLGAGLQRDDRSRRRAGDQDHPRADGCYGCHRRCRAVLVPEQDAVGQIHARLFRQRRSGAAVGHQP